MYQLVWIMCPQLKQKTVDLNKYLLIPYMVKERSKLIPKQGVLFEDRSTHVPSISYNISRRILKEKCPHRGSGSARLSDTVFSVTFYGTVQNCDEFY